MKRKTCVALLALSSGLMMVFAATTADKCTEKYDACKGSCETLGRNCKTHGNRDDYCAARVSECMANCEKDLKACQAKNK